MSLPAYYTLYCTIIRYKYRHCIKMTVLARVGKTTGLFCDSRHNDVTLWGPIRWWLYNSIGLFFVPPYLLCIASECIYSILIYNNTFGGEVQFRRYLVKDAYVQKRDCWNITGLKSTALGISRECISTCPPMTFHIKYVRVHKPMS